MFARRRMRIRNLRRLAQRLVEGAPITSAARGSGGSEGGGEVGTSADGVEAGSGGVVAVAIYGMPVLTAAAAATEGAAFGLFPALWIVVNAIWIYQVTVDTGHFDVLRRSFARISADRRIQGVTAKPDKERDGSRPEHGSPISAHRSGLAAPADGHRGIGALGIAFRVGRIRACRCHWHRISAGEHRSTCDLRHA